MKDEQDKPMPTETFPAFSRRTFSEDIDTISAAFRRNGVSWGKVGDIELRMDQLPAQLELAPARPEPTPEAPRDRDGLTTEEQKLYYGSAEG